MLGVMLLLLLLRREWKSICVYMACLMFLFFFVVPCFALFFLFWILTINTLSSLVEVVLFFAKRTAFCFFFVLFLFICNAIPSQKLKIQFLELR
jgi:hypothetical protein